MEYSAYKLKTINALMRDYILDWSAKEKKQLKQVSSVLKFKSDNRRTFHKST